MRIAVLLLVASCQSGDFNYRPGQKEAEQIVWHGLYGMKDDPPPVEWIGNEGWEVAGQMVYGDTAIGWKVQVACGSPSYEWPIEMTKYAHELIHWKCFLETGDVDVAHSHCDWSLEGRANSLLADLHL